MVHACLLIAITQFKIHNPIYNTHLLNKRFTFIEALMPFTFQEQILRFHLLNERKQFETLVQELSNFAIKKFSFVHSWT